jgi:ribosomal protein S18 acetylase RimI-like enzyme
MSAYRFCRTDDIGLLVDALNRCRPPDGLDEPQTPATFKRAIRDLQVWCSSCMVAFESSDPIGVLIGAKRPTCTLIHSISIHPEHRRQGHGRHLLASLSSKLAILGPPRLIAEVPEDLVAACRLFRASGYVQEARLTDYVLDATRHAAAWWDDQPGQPAAGTRAGAFLVPVTVDDLTANDLLAQPQRCWERSTETLTARKAEITGLAAASDEGIEAFVLYTARAAHEAEIVALRSVIDDGGARLRELLSRLRGRGIERFSFRRVHPCELSPEGLQTLGFTSAGTHLRFTATARSQ